MRFPPVYLYIFVRSECICKGNRNAKETWKKTIDSDCSVRSLPGRSFAFNQAPCWCFQILCCFEYELCRENKNRAKRANVSLASYMSSWRAFLLTRGESYSSIRLRLGIQTVSPTFQVTSKAQSQNKLRESLALYCPTCSMFTNKNLFSCWSMRCWNFKPFANVQHSS